MIIPEYSQSEPETMMMTATTPSSREHCPMSIILIIEDEANIRQFVTVNLEARGYTIVQASSAEEGLQKMRYEKPEAAILDIKLPMMNGWDMLKVVAADPTLPNIPVIILTSFLSTRNLDEQGYPNIRELLSKPISANDLVKAVKKVIG